MSDKTKKHVAYCRVSTDNDDQLNSLQNQREHYQEKFTQPGITTTKCGMLYRRDGSYEFLEGIFADEGISGTSLKNRQAFAKMMEYAKRKEFDVILVKSISRFTRSVEDGTKALKDLKEWGVEVIFEDGNLSSIRDEMPINVLMTVAQEESRAKSYAVKMGIRRLQKNGGWNTGEPYGYEINNGFLQVNPTEANAVRKIYRLFLDEGYGVGKIARYLNAKGIPTKKGMKWSQQQIRRILLSPLYNGVQTTHTKESYDINRHLYNLVDEDEWIVHEKPELIIIDNDTFKAVQAEYENRTETYSQHKSHYSAKHLVSNLLTCGCCGGPMKRKKRNSSRDIGYEWTCQMNDMYGNARCSSRNAVPEEVLIDSIKASITKRKNYDMTYLVERYMAHNFTFDTSPERMAELGTAKDKIERKIDANFEGYTDGDIPKEEYKRRNAALRKSLAGVQAEIDKIAYIDKHKAAALQQYTRLQKTLDGLDLDNLTNEDLRKVLKRITVKSFKPANSKRKDMRMLIYDYHFLETTDMQLYDKVETVPDDKPCFTEDSFFIDIIGATTYAVGQD